MSGKKKKQIKLATKSEHVQSFMPMLEALQAQNELNQVLKNRVEKACGLLDEGVPLYPNDFSKDTEVSDIWAIMTISEEKSWRLWARSLNLPAGYHS